ncbi:hypothetical protein QWI17_09380 [Gilvimarinus sp. SDUM040013]|uniref:Type IV pilus biogenesis protein PilP n=1 Tax=Gilvimarinus gilvus TaxID=3058038 RepID=A0ABU4S017_9GAMM|nr:hypothetical protein [Gilvimarinus sp. SDUM040013]MDO3386047.1 hypothetical protein [Gilvimarinus sp. SDUM040013]MDX6850500.1 hypothetical protein [Gilvimarinus sp. SDUM040013]
MKTSEKVLIGILVVAGAAIGYSELSGDSDSVADKEIVKVPDPVLVPVQEYKDQSVDPVIRLPGNAETLITKEHQLLVAGYDAKIAEHKKTADIAEVDVDKAKAELANRRKEGESLASHNTMYNPQQPTTIDTAASKSEHVPSQVAINTFLPDGRAITSINGVSTVVSEGQTYAGITIKNIDRSGQRLTYTDGGVSKSIAYSKLVGRSHPTVKPMKSSTK